MKYCDALNGSLNIERDRVHFCVAVKQNMPTIPWDPDEELPLERIRSVRDALLKGLNEDMDKPIEAYETFGITGGISGHPCKGCRHIVEIDDGSPLKPTDHLSGYLHLQAFTYCNAKCTYCNLRMDEGRTPLSRGKELDIAVYRGVRQLLDNKALAPTCRIIFSSGEPSLSREGMQVLTDVTRMGLPTLINTNAIRFAPEIEAALNAGNCHVQVSLESGDRESYLAVKGVDRFDCAAENVDRYNRAAKGGSVFWLKYIVFSQTKSFENIDKFVAFCKELNIKNVVVNANYNEGEDIDSNCTAGRKSGDSADLGDKADMETLEAYGYLATSLELQGINVHKETAHLSTNEQKLAKREYARAVLRALGITADDMEPLIQRVVAGMDYAHCPTETPEWRTYMAGVLQAVPNDCRNIALFGAGTHARKIYHMFRDLKLKPVVAFDNNASGQSPFDFPVVKPVEVSFFDIGSVVIASNAYHLQIYDQMQKMPGFSNIKIIDPYLNLPLE